VIENGIVTTDVRMSRRLLGSNVGLPSSKLVQ